MSRLQDDISATRASLFVGRKNELRHLHAWLENGDAPTTVFSLSGMGGIGKSALMAEMLRQARVHGIQGIWLDGRAGTHTPTGFIDHLSTALAMDALDGHPNDNPLNLLFAALSNHRFVLCIDNFEALSGIEGWLLEVLIPRFPNAGILLVVASRQGLSIAWRRDPAWRSRLVEMPLPHFTRLESLTYLQRFNLQPDRTQWIVRQTNGHPLALALVAEAAAHAEDDAASTAVSTVVSSQLLRELVAPELQDALDVLTLVSVSDQHLISEVLNRQLSAREYHTLAGLSFLHMTPNGLALHDVARIHLLTDLQLRNPHRLSVFRDRIARILGRMMRTAPRSRQRVIASQLLTLGLDALPIRSAYADLGVSPHAFHMDVFRTGDLPKLHKILSDWCTYSVDPDSSDVYHRFLDDLAVSFPQTIQVIRRSDGEVIAMFIMMMIYDATAQILARYFLEELLECYDPDEMNRQPDEADSYFAVLGAYDAENEEYPGSELVGAFIRDGLALLGEGTRVSLVLTNGDLKELLYKLGFQFRATRPGVGDTSFAKAEVAELDFRQRDFSGWIQQLLQSTYGALPAQPIMISEEWVKEALRGLNSPRQVGRSQLVCALSWSGDDLQAYLQGVLDGSLEVGLGPEQRKLLNVTYSKAANATSAAEKLNMSRATYYRHLRTAVGIIAKALGTEMEHSIR